MLRLAGPQPVVQLPGERDELVYLPLGVGVVIPPWNFPLAILAGMTVAALVAGNTVVIKPSSETPTIAAKFAEVLLEAGFPPRAFTLLHRQRRGGRRSCWWRIPRRASFRSPARATWACASTNWRPSRSPGRSGSSAWWRKWAARTRLSWIGDADLDSAVDGVLASAFGYQGQKCSACSRAIVDDKVYDAFLEKLRGEREGIRWARRTIRRNYMGPVISAARAQDDPGLHRGRAEAKAAWWRAAQPAAGEGYFMPPTIIADVDSQARIFQEEIFGPVLAVTKAQGFRTRAGTGQRF